MGHQGRCSASQAIVVTASLLSIILLHFETTEATTFTVGDTSGWTYNIQSWADGKRFKTGDVLTFNYDPSAHDVATVDLKGYNSCSLSLKSKTYSSGKDNIKLKKGKNYFICSIPGHCDGGLKIVVDAS
ncbi:hypothetical protein Tsubulata_026591 [Turnera subulata]|uniref:Basic blue protein n=1 Tax=Turnera subulata TaxID=218843 RepID=A0A9Q0JH18_9ROSI|nr:hypothetical protein Tsubulata_026591 [Turnera subulata]